MSEDAQMRECAKEEQKPAATVMHVRMAKASQADMDTAYRIMNLLASMDRGHYPSNEEGSPTFFNSDDWEHLQFLHQQIIEIADNSGGVSRVIGAAGILLNEENGLIDPDDDCIELHPNLKAINKVGEEAAQLRARVAELETDLETAKGRIVHLDGRLSEVNGEVLRLEMATKHMLKLQEERDAAVIKVDELEADRRRVSDMVNKAWADGKAEGHGDATAEASVVIGELRARVAELEAERAEREKQKPVFWYRPHSDGHGYDGPIHDSQIEPVRRQSGAWLPLFSSTVHQALTPEQIEKADEAIREALGDASDCMRVWDAWSYGTMGPDDFWPVAESDERVAEIRNAVVAALGFKVEG